MNSPLAQFLITCAGWTLLHFVWQGLAVAAWLAASLRLLRLASANKRYLTGCAAMILMAAAPLLTFQHLAKQYEQPAPLPATSAVVKSPVLENPSDARIETVSVVTMLSKASQSKPTLAARVENNLPWLVMAWAAGVFLLSARLFAGWLQVRRLQRTAGEPLTGAWNERLAQLAKRLSVSRPVRLLESALVEVPAVAGWLRPVILLPASCLAGLSPAQLEAVLAHELAHIRRHDYLVNLFQNLVETLLFYHPAVWWVSRCIRNERENCCDDLAVHACGDRVLYARALTTLEELRQSPGQLALAAGGAPLLKRIRRLAGRSDREIGRSGWPVALMLMLTMVVALAICLRSDPARANEKQASAGTVGIVPILPATNNVSLGTQIPEPSAMYTRIFYFDTNALHLFLEKKENSQREYTNWNAVEFRRFLDLAGVDFDLTKPANLGKALFYKDRKGMLWVHSTEEDLDKISESIEAINLGYATDRANQTVQPPLTSAGENPPEVVTIEADGNLRFGPGGESVTVDRLKEQLLEAVQKNPQIRLNLRADKNAPFGQIAKVMNAAKEAKVKLVSAFNQQAPLWIASPITITYGPPMKPAATNVQLSAKTIRPQISIRTKFVMVDTKPGHADAFGGVFQRTGVRLQTNEPVKFPETSFARTPPMNSLCSLLPSGTNTPLLQLTGILTDPQFQAAINDLEERNGNELLNAPDITTEANRQAEVQILDYQTVVTGLNQTTDYRGNVTNDFQTTKMAFGRVLDVIPKYSESGTNIDLLVRGVETEFLGYT